MITALDSSVLLDILIDNEFAESSESAVIHLGQQGRLIVSECVVAEIYPAIKKKITDFLQDFGIEFQSSSFENAQLAGKHFELYLMRKGNKKRVVADFIIAAHAYTFANQLLARDQGYFRDYFKKLTIITPKSLKS